MKKLYSILTSLILLTFTSAKAEIGVGVSGALHMLDVSGSETTRQSGEVNRGSQEEDVMVGEVFVEAIAENGWTVGLAYIPTRDMGSKSRSDSNSDGDTGTYKAQAELDNVMQIYTDLPLSDRVHFKVGVQHVTLTTLESLNSGSAYPNEDLLGWTVGIGTKGDLPYGNLYYKAEATFTDFEDYEGVSNGNRVAADLDDVAAKFSIGYKF